MYDNGVTNTGIQKYKNYWVDTSWSIKIKVKEEKIAIVYTMIDYKLKAMHDEYDKLNFSPMRHNIKACPRERKLVWWFQYVYSRHW